MRSSLDVADVPPRERRERLRLREAYPYGARIEAGADMAEDHRAFLDWTRGYDDGTAEGTNTLAIHEGRIASSECPVLRLHGTETVEQLVADAIASGALVRILESWQGPPIRTWAVYRAELRGAPRLEAFLDVIPRDRPPSVSESTSALGVESKSPKLSR